MKMTLELDFSDDPQVKSLLRKILDKAFNKALTDEDMTKKLAQQAIKTVSEGFEGAMEWFWEDVNLAEIQKHIEKMMKKALMKGLTD